MTDIENSLVYTYFSNPHEQGLKMTKANLKDKSHLVVYLIVVGLFATIEAFYQFFIVFIDTIEPSYMGPIIQAIGILPVICGISLVIPWSAKRNAKQEAMLSVLAFVIVMLTVGGFFYISLASHGVRYLTIITGSVCMLLVQFFLSSFKRKMSTIQCVIVAMLLLFIGLKLPPVLLIPRMVDWF